jgi:hypothetical protein
MPAPGAKACRTGAIAFLCFPAGGSGPYGTGQSLYVINADGSGLRRVKLIVPTTESEPRTARGRPRLAR